MKVKLLPGYPRDVVASHDRRVLDLIRRKLVSAAIWVRPFNPELAAAAGDLKPQQLRGMGFKRYIGEKEPGESLRQFMLYGEVPVASRNEHLVAAEVRTCDALFRCFAPERGAIRLDMLDQREVPDEFHIDGSKLRLWTSLNYSGPEWLARHDASYRAFERGDAACICRNRRHIRSVPPQAIVLFKGWQYPGHKIEGKLLLNRKSAMGWVHSSAVHLAAFPRVSLAWHYA